MKKKLTVSTQNKILNAVLLQSCHKFQDPFYNTTDIKRGKKNGNVMFKK